MSGAAGRATMRQAFGLPLGLALLAASACAPVPRAAPESEPSPPEAEQRFAEEAYTTYFAFNSDRLDDEARKVVAQAVASAKSAKLDKVVISGHSDRVGPASYNRRLAEARVEAVATAFVDAGLPLSKIEMKVFGEDRPQVETPDGQSAAENRRAEIRLVKAVAAPAAQAGTAPVGERATEEATETTEKSTTADRAGDRPCDYVYIWSAGRAVPVCLEKRTQALPQPK